MQTNEFKAFLSQIAQLTAQQKKETLEYLKSECDSDTVHAILDQVDSCPHCGATTLYKWGSNARLQRYKCTACNRTFNALTNTPLARLRHKDIWVQYAQELIEGESVHHAAQRCGVADSTSFRWRHRFLKIPSLSQVQELEGIVEADETFFLESHKGERTLERIARKRGGSASQRGLSKEQIPVLIVRDRGKHTVDAVLPANTTEEITKVLSSVISPDALLCSDGNRIYQAFAKKMKLVHKAINVSAKEYVKEGTYHIQNVNAYDSRLKNWMRHFNGVATKYLESYLGWMRMLDSQPGITPESVLALSASRLSTVNAN